MTPLTAKGAMRRRQVLEAAAGLLLAEGFRALTHRRVAEAAGVPLGTTTYYFMDRRDLLEATVSLLLDREQARRADVAAPETSPKAVASALVRLLITTGQGSSAREQAVVVYERLGEALRDEGLRPLVIRDYGDLQAHVARILTAMPGALDPSLVLAMAEGRLLQWLASDSALDALVETLAADLATLVDWGQ